MKALKTWLVYKKKNKRFQKNHQTLQDTDTNLSIYDMKKGAHTNIMKKLKIFLLNDKRV